MIDIFKKRRIILEKFHLRLDLACEEGRKVLAALNVETHPSPARFCTSIHLQLFFAHEGGGEVTSAIKK